MGSDFEELHRTIVMEARVGPGLAMQAELGYSAGQCAPVFTNRLSGLWPLPSSPAGRHGGSAVLRTSLQPLLPLPPGMITLRYMVIIMPGRRLRIRLATIQFPTSKRRMTTPVRNAAACAALRA